MPDGETDERDLWDEPSAEQRRALEFEHTAEIGELLASHYDPTWGDLGHSRHSIDLPAAKLAHRVHEYADIATGRKRLFSDRTGPFGDHIRLWAWWD